MERDLNRGGNEESWFDLPDPADWEGSYLGDLHRFTVEFDLEALVVRGRRALSSGEYGEATEWYRAAVGIRYPDKLIPTRVPRGIRSPIGGIEFMKLFDAPQDPLADNAFLWARRKPLLERVLLIGDVVPLLSEEDQEVVASDMRWLAPAIARWAALLGPAAREALAKSPWRECRRQLIRHAWSDLSDEVRDILSHDDDVKVRVLIRGRGGQLRDPLDHARWANARHGEIPRGVDRFAWLAEHDEAQRDRRRELRGEGL